MTIRYGLSDKPDILVARVPLELECERTIIKIGLGFVFMLFFFAVAAVREIAGGALKIEPSIRSERAPPDNEINPLE